MSLGLSPRQEECLRLTAFLTDKEIAHRLGLSEPTVKKHVHEACRRLGVNRRKAALARLDPNVPGPNHPIDAGARPRDPRADLARTPEGRASDAARARRPIGAPDDVVGGGATALGPSAAGTGHGMSDDRSPRPPSGYRAPPRSWLFRLMIIAGLIVATALIAEVAANATAGFARRAQAVDQMVSH